MTDEENLSFDMQAVKALSLGRTDTYVAVLDLMADPSKLNSAIRKHIDAVMNSDFNHRDVCIEETQALNILLATGVVSLDINTETIPEKDNVTNDPDGIPLGFIELARVESTFLKEIDEHKAQALKAALEAEIGPRKARSAAR